MHVRMRELVGDSNQSKLQLVHINPEPIGIITLPTKKHLEYKNKIWSIWNNSSSEQRQKHTDLKEHLCNTSDQNLFNLFPQLSELKHDIMKFIISYIQQIGYECEEVIINSAWLNNSQKGSVLDFHFHSNSFISANYFIDFSAEKHSQLTFQNDRVFAGKSPSFQTLVIPRSKKPTIYNTECIGLNAKEGQIAIWRSHQIHGYSTPNNSGNRLTLSLNSIPKKMDNGKYSFYISD